MTKKNFTANAIADATAETLPGQLEITAGQSQGRKTYDVEEAAAFMDAGQTAGRKGVKLPRINLAFTPKVYDFVKVTARATGLTMTEYINMIIEQFMAEHQETYQQAKAFLEALQRNNK